MTKEEFEELSADISEIDLVRFLEKRRRKLRQSAESVAMPEEPSFYSESDYRYRNDPEFAAAVASLENIADRNGFTPYDLKQIAFKAALNIQMLTFSQALYVAPTSGTTK
jgi:hypothetical protein